MATVKIFRYERLNGRLDEFELVTPWATRAAIEARGGRRVIEESGREVDTSLLDEEGFLKEEKA